MRQPLLIFICCLFYSFSVAQLKQEYLAEKQSNSILLSDETRLILSSINTSTTYRKYKAIIKNKRANHLSSVGIYYDQFQKVKDAEVIINSLSGEELKKYKLKDFDDIGLGLSNTASDGRLKLLEPAVSDWPYIIQVSYEVEKNGSLHFPIWRPQPEERLRVLDAKFVVLDEANKGFRYNQKNVAIASIEEGEHGKIYTWKVENLAPYVYEDYNHDSDDYSPVVYTAPNLFEIDGIAGDMTSWQDLGIWANKLNQGKNDLDPEKLKSLDDKIEKIKLDEDKVEVIYDFLQKNSRYVSIQLGIGGWQPFSASYVQEKKYGDCKALSYFTKALLNRYGIDAYYTLIKAGSHASEVEESFPNAHFNHAIVTVPMASDTLFLECTSQTNPFGYLGKFTSDRNALLISENGGELIRTKKYEAYQNKQITITKVKLNEDASSDVAFSRIFEGLEIENHYFLSLYNSNKNDHRKWILDNHSWGQAKIDSFSLMELKEGVIPVGGFTVFFNNKKEGKKLGNRLFLEPGKYFTSYLTKLTSASREKSIKIKYGYVQSDSITYELSANMIIENHPEEVDIKTKFGHYKRKIVKEINKVSFQREFLLFDGEYSAIDYQAFKDFVNAVIKYDSQQIVLLKKT